MVLAITGKVFSIPEYRRIFNGHLLDLIESTFNSTYLTPWASHLTTATGNSLRISSTAATRRTRSRWVCTCATTA